METLICVHSNKLYPQSHNHRSCTFHKEMIKCKEETFRQTLDTFNIKKAQKNNLRICGNRCCLFSLPRVLTPPHPSPCRYQLPATTVTSVCDKAATEINARSTLNDKPKWRTNERTDGRLRFPCQLPNLVAIHKRKEPNLNSPLPHVIMESRQIS